MQGVHDVLYNDQTKKFEHEYLDLEQRHITSEDLAETFRNLAVVHNQHMRPFNVVKLIFRIVLLAMVLCVVLGIIFLCSPIYMEKFSSYLFASAISFSLVIALGIIALGSVKYAQSIRQKCKAKLDEVLENENTTNYDPHGVHLQAMWSDILPTDSFFYKFKMFFDWGAPSICIQLQDNLDKVELGEEDESHEDVVLDEDTHEEIDVSETNIQ